MGVYEVTYEDHHVRKVIAEDFFTVAVILHNRPEESIHGQPMSVVKVKEHSHQHHNQGDQLWVM